MQALVADDSAEAKPGRQAPCSNSRRVLVQKADSDHAAPHIEPRLFVSCNFEQGGPRA